MDFLVDHTGNEVLALVRYIAKTDDKATSVVYLFPILLQRDEGISIQTVRSVLTELEERGYIEILQTPDYNLTENQRLKRDDEGDYYFIEVKKDFYEYSEALELTANSFTYTTHDSRNTKSGKQAELTFISLTVPHVTFGLGSFNLPSMREGNTFHIVSHCLAKHPNRTIKLDQLKEELAATGTPLHGVSNLKETLRNSIFGVGKTLAAFAEVSPKAILIKSSAVLTEAQFEAIRKASKQSSADSE